MITTNQKDHLQLMSWARYPPAIGPTTGPAKEPAVKIPIAFPRRSLCIKSAMTPPPMATGAAPTQPARNRKTINIGKEFARAQPTVKATKSASQLFRMILLPQTSEAGPKTLKGQRDSRLSSCRTYRGPTAFPRTKTDTTKPSNISSEL